jgi:hypothetical protein
MCWGLLVVLPPDVAGPIPVRVEKKSKEENGTCLEGSSEKALEEIEKRSLRSNA